MASGDTKLSICSDALIMLGAKPLSSFSEGTDAAQICDRLYDDIRDSTIGMHPWTCLLYTSPSPRDAHESRMPSSA